MPWVMFAPLKKRCRTKVMIKKFTEIGTGRMMPIALAMHKLLLTLAPLLTP